jgi:alpha-ketoglutarate-dependent taurine dioxygenase
MKKPFSGFKAIKPKKVTANFEDLVRCGPLTKDAALPLLIEPRDSDLDYLVWLEQKRAWLDQMLYRHGALLFRGFPVDTLAQFEAFAGKLTDDLYGEYGDLPPAEGKVYGVTPYPPSDVILFHNESSHLDRWPMKQFFFCDIPAQAGGATPIVDCRTLYQSIDPELIRLFEQHQLRYVRNFIEGVDVDWRDFFKTDDRAKVEAHCRENGIAFSWKNENDLMTYQIVPATARHPVTGESVFFNQIQLHHVSCLHPDLRTAMEAMFPPEDLPRNVYFGDGKPIADDIVEALKADCWEHAVSFPWQHGDILMVDNMLVSHARKAYEPPRKMYVAMGDITS